MHAERHVVVATTATGGAATVYTEVVTGKVCSVAYAKHGSAAFADGVDFTITSEQTGQTIWTESDVNASKTVAPRQAVHSTAGVAALYAGGGSAVLDDVIVASERIKIVIGSGGDAKIGTFTFVIG
jgi:hypothetical protein